jgi:WD40 repeat protein
VFSPDGGTLATAGGDGVLRLWDVATRVEQGSPFTGHTEEVTALAFSPDGNTLASSSLDGSVRVWDRATQQEIGAPLVGHTGFVESVAFSPTGGVIASVGDETARLWNVGYLVGTHAYLCSEVHRSLTRDEWHQNVGSGPAFRQECQVSVQSSRA